MIVLFVRLIYSKVRLYYGEVRMTETTLSVKGQIVIPRTVRKRLGLKVGQKFEVDVMSDGTMLVIPIHRQVVQALELPNAERLEKALTEERRKDKERAEKMAKELKA